MPGALARLEFTRLRVRLSRKALFWGRENTLPSPAVETGRPGAAAGPVLGCGSTPTWWAACVWKGAVARFLPQGQCLRSSLCYSGDEREPIE